MLDASNSATSTRLTERLRGIVEAGWFQNFIIAVIIVNAITIGLETSPTAMATAGGLLYALDMLALAIFVAEIAAKLFVYRLAFFRNAWNVFDFAIVAIALIPAGQGLSVLRALRILRALRLISMVPQMRLVVQALLSAIPAMGSVIALMSLIFYVASVMATKLYGADFPEWFGTVGASFYTLFQIMTLESWSMGIVRPVMEVHPTAWLFFVPFILVITFAVMNLFIAIVVNSMTNAAEQDAGAKGKSGGAAGDAGEVPARAADVEALVREIGLLRAEVRALAEGQAQARGEKS